MTSKQTAHKAWAGAAATLLAYAAARLGLAEAPPIDSVLDAFEVAGELLVAGGLGWLATWLAPRNRARGGLEQRRRAML